MTENNVSERDAEVHVNGEIINVKIMDLGENFGEKAIPNHDKILIVYDN